MTPQRTAAVVAAFATALLLAACAPGGSAPATRTKLGPVSQDLGTGEITLTVWDQNTEGGSDQAQRELNSAFEKKYPNVTINRVARSFSDLKTTLKLALSSDNPPDVVQANQGYPDMGAFVKAGLLRPVDDYAGLYGWRAYYPSGQLKLNSFTADGKTWQSGDLYGISQTGELVGLYYNRSVLRRAGISGPPTTLRQLSEDMAKVKATGALPLSYGDVEKSPGIHLYGFTLSALAGAKKPDDLVRSAGYAWTDAEPVQAATILRDWQQKGYLTPGANGVARDAAVSSFGRGGAAFMITGTWYQAPMESSSAGKDIGFTALTPPDSTTPVTMGGQGLAWTITTKSAHADAAAAYIDFVAGRSAGDILVKTGNLPAVVPAGDVPPAGTVAADITTNYQRISQSNGITPYLDYATPTFYGTLTEAVQDLVALRVTPREFAQKLQTDYAAFRKSNG
jgi:raffinose/stachyose/melibiose transport system substrate-binding protein